MAFNIENFASFSNVANAGSVRGFGYKSSTDTLATIVASAYFNTIAPKLSVNDIMFIAGSDAEGMYKITAVTPNVTMDAYIDGSSVANVAANTTSGGSELLFPVAVTGGATDNYDIIVDRKITVTRVVFQFNGAGAASDTIQVLNSTNAITEAFDGNQSDTASLPAVTVNDANATIAAGGTLRVTQTDAAGNDAPPMTVYVYAIPVA